MTVYHYKLPDIPEGRDYLLEINPRYVERTQADRLNVIDARWIDTETGLFIDITTIRRDDVRVFNGVEGALMVKDRHHYLVCLCDPPARVLSATQQCLTCTAGRRRKTSSLCERVSSRTRRSRYHSRMWRYSKRNMGTTP